MADFDVTFDLSDNIFDTKFESTTIIKGSSKDIIVDQHYNPKSENPQSGLAVAEAVSSKVDKIEGKGLSSNDYTDEDKQKIDRLVQPTAKVDKDGKVTTITLTDKDGSTTSTIPDGNDGFSPILTTSELQDGVRVDITDIEGIKSFTLHNGEKGDTYNLTESDKEEIADKISDKLPATLPNPHPINFTGAVQGKYDGSEELTLDIPQGGGGGSSIKTYQLLDRFILEEEVGMFQITELNNRTPLIKLKLTDALLVLHSKPTSTNTFTSRYMQTLLNVPNYGGGHAIQLVDSLGKTEELTSTIFAELKYSYNNNHYWQLLRARGSDQGVQHFVKLETYESNSQIQHIIWQTSNNAVFGVGSYVELWGVVK